MIRPGSLRGDAPAALTRGQRAHVALLYGLGEHPKRLATAYDVPVDRIEKIATQQQVVHGEAASPDLRRYLDTVQRLAAAVAPTPGQRDEINAEILRVYREHSDGSFPVMLAQTLRQSHAADTALKAVGDLGLPADRINVWLCDGILPVAATLYALAGLSLREVNRIDRQSLDVDGLLVLAALRGHTV